MPKGTRRRITARRAIKEPGASVRVKPRNYQPNKAELEEVVKIDATPEQFAARALRPIRIIEDD